MCKRKKRKQTTTHSVKKGGVVREDGTKQRWKKEDEEERISSALQLERGPNSYGIQPLGNLLFASSRNVRDSGLGSLWKLSDETCCDILSLLGAKDLAVLALVSKAMYVFACQDSLWRSLVLEKFGGDFKFKGCWRRTYVAAVAPSSPAFTALKVSGFFSDYLFQSWLCSSLRMRKEWLSVDNIDRRSNLSVEEFVAEYEEPNKPVIITDALQNWPAMKSWNREYLIDLAGNVSFAVGPVEMTLDDYFLYAQTANEERPLYLFDPKFGEKIPNLSSDYEVPVYFREDLFSILGNGRPDYRWLILGPARSGSSFHIDPNSTSAWNAVIKGSKKWILFPPDVDPPGVHPSPDGAEVAAPVSITEWFMNFYQETKRWKKKPLECICRAGEVMFIPNGWWHLVINLEDSIAITQNYVSRRNLLNVLGFLNRPNCAQLVSGTRDRVNLYVKFKSRYEELFPGSIEELQRKANEKAQQNNVKSFWETVTDAKVGSFKFGF